MSIPVDRPRAETQLNTRDRIKAVAAELYVLHGHDGFSFRDVAAVIGTTRANIHHHFGTKRHLMDELVQDFADSAQARIEHHWADGRRTFSERLAMQLEDLRSFYDRFNRGPENRNTWSPLSRLRHDLQTLGEPAAAALERVNRTYDTCLRRALAAAVATGELSPDTPVDDLARILRVMLLSCPPMTQDAGAFREIEQLFAAVDRVVGSAWGRPAG